MATLINDTKHSIIEVGYTTKFILAPQNEQQAKEFFNNIDIENSCLGSVGLVAPNCSTWVRGDDDLEVFASSLPVVTGDPQKWLDKKEVRFNKYLKVLWAIQERIENPLNVRLKNYKNRNEDAFFWLVDEIDFSLDAQAAEWRKQLDSLKSDNSKLFNHPI